MEAKREIEPHKITKPIQLLAAWLSGLVLVDSCFLVAASQVLQPSWASAALVVASIVNVPLFLIAIFILQTRFRPEMQEDSFYARYLESKTGYTKREVTIESFAAIREDIARLDKVVAEKVLAGMGEGELQAELKRVKWSSVTVMLNKTLSTFGVIAEALSKHGISVHETFGGGARVPNIFKVSLGGGFDVEQVRNLVNVLSEISDGWISFAHDETRDGEFNKQVLIGAYGDYKHGVELSKAKLILERQGITELEMYQMLGR